MAEVVEPYTRTCKMCGQERVKRPKNTEKQSLPVFVCMRCDRTDKG